MKKILVLTMLMAVLMCGCAPEVNAANAAPAASASPAVLETAAPTPSPAPTPKPISDEVMALLDENEEIWIEKHLRHYMVGRLIIPAADINVAVFIHGEGADAAEIRQNVCDAVDSAILYSDGVGNVIADHNNQGFINLPQVKLGDKAYLVAGDCIISLECDLVTDGINTGNGITDKDGKWITAEEDFTFYTCGEDWVNVKIAGFKEIDEDVFEMQTPSWLLEETPVQEEDIYLE